MSGRDEPRAIRGSDEPHSRKEHDGTGACSKFCLLMWKNFLQQKRHCKQTIVELLLPVITMAMVLILRSEIQPTNRSLRTYRMLAAHSLEFAVPVLAAMNYSKMSIAYSPESPVLQEVLNKASNKLLSLNTKFIGNLGVNVKVNAYKNSEKLKSLYTSEQETKIVIAGVEFDDKLSGTEVTYALSNDQSHLFEAMLKDLEAKINNIKYKSYGLTTTTLEDVFMSVGSDVDPVHLESDAVEFSQNRTNSNVSSIAPIKRGKLCKQHVLAVWYKLWLVYTRSRVLLAMQLLVPLVLVSASLSTVTWLMSIQPIIKKRALTLAEGFVETETVLTYDGNSNTSIGALAKTGYENIFKSAKLKTMKLTVINKPLDDYYLERTKTHTDMAHLRYRLLTGASFSDNATATAWFSNFGYHDLAISLATVHEALLKGLKPNASLRVFNFPLEVNYSNQTSMNFVKLLSMQLSSGIGSSLGIVSASFIMFYIKERILRAKLLQKAAGIQPVILWGSAAVFDWAWFCIICLTIVLSCAAFQVIGLATATELGRLYVALMVYGAAMLPLQYVMSNVFSGPAMGFVGMFFINILLGQMAPLIMQPLLDPALGTMVVTSALDSALKFFPLYSLVISVTNLNEAGLNEWSCMKSCSSLAAIMPNFGQCSMKVMCEKYNRICCVRENPYFEWEKPGIMRYLVFMLVSGMVFWVVHMFIEYDIHHKICCNWRKRQPPPLDESAMDQDVVAEMRAVKEVENTSLRQHSLVAKNLTKYYKKYLAVNQVSFMVADAEVLGLLGVNGAGKTTTFKMLIGDEIISTGEAYVSGYSVKTEITSAHKHMGYCPQFDAVFNELTGRETLRLFLMLRGLPHQTSAHAERLAHELGFTKHLDKRVGAYSGGNKRKLSTAVALLGLTRLVFVDEPTTGVDPAAKRQVWRAIRGVGRAGHGVVLTSHSMEECEALCSRLTIMVNGTFQCLGTPQHLKNKFSEGFTLRIKMKIDKQSEGSSANDARGIEAVKRYVASNFTSPKLMEEYKGLLTYYLSDRNFAWSKMFGIMERCRQTHDVEDYTITQTTLEQIFLQFTKYQKEIH